MKKITLIRHGKSSWEYNVTDRDRPLSTRGVTDAKLVADHFINKKIKIPTTIFSSPANRALSTCKIFVKTFGFSESSIKIIDDLYDFDGQNVINFIKELPNDYDDVMIFGHNHALTSISNIFGNTFIDNLPTSGLVSLNIDIEKWTDLKKGTTEYIIVPKSLK
jgi:phosphohistidine phosphatase